MRKSEPGFGGVDLLILLFIVGLLVGGFYFVFHAPETTSSSPGHPEKTAAKVPVPAREPVPRPGPENSGGRQPAGKSKTGKTVAGGTDSGSSRPVEKSRAENGALAGEGAFTIEGTVYSLGGGVPLAGCRVSFRQLTATTGPDGGFHLAADGGVGPLSFSCDGYRSEMISRFAIEAGSGMAVFDVYLSGREDVTRGRIEINGVSGRVYDKASGAPLYRAWVVVGRHRTRTDKAGFFELWGNDSGYASLKVSARGYVGEMISGLDFDNLANPLYCEIMLEPNAGGKPRFALVGIGARLVPDPEGHGCRIAAVLEDSPAAREGLEPGDRMLAVDGVAVDESRPAEVVELIRGREGEPVDLMIERGGEILKITCVRERVVY